MFLSTPEQLLQFDAVPYKNTQGLINLIFYNCCRYRTLRQIRSSVSDAYRGAVARRVACHWYAYWCLHDCSMTLSWVCWSQPLIHWTSGDFTPCKNTEYVCVYQTTLQSLADARRLYTICTGCDGVSVFGRKASVSYWLWISGFKSLVCRLIGLNSGNRVGTRIFGTSCVQWKQC